MTKYIFVTGGVVSALGKGICSASIGRLLRSRGFQVTMLKIDPYINVDAGLMNPYQHGEVFVTDDGSETDLDLGHYERFVDIPLTKLSNVTTGTVYLSVIQKERDGGHYLGQTVQVIPHITDEIKADIHRCAEAAEAEIIITEIGGTVGDIEGQPFIEAIRQMRHDVGAQNVLYVHVTLVPFLGQVGEMKTKPTQHSVRVLRSMGIQPEVLICRVAEPMTKENRAKISLFCDLPGEAIIESHDADSVYEVPLMFEDQGLADLIAGKLGLEPREQDNREWRRMVERLRAPTHRVRVAMVGKYMDLHDAYISVTEALAHGGIANDARVDIKYIESEDLETHDPGELLGDVDAVVVPGGFGVRGLEGKINAIRYARENGVPFLGLCLGLQCAVIEFARNVCGLEGANTKEATEDTPHPVVILLKEQEQVTEMGGTQRLGAYPCKIKPGSLAERLYGASEVSERHRHRYEVSNQYRDTLEQGGLVFGGTSPSGDLVEMIELSDHPFFIASQFHPEFKSRPNRAHPLFAGVVKAALDRQQVAA
ncbi:MAG: CTP synthase, partial [Armatimonadota bacterium]